jgi:hypothetical protein
MNIKTSTIPLDDRPWDDCENSLAVSDEVYPANLLRNIYLEISEKGSVIRPLTHPTLLHYGHEEGP